MAAFLARMLDLLVVEGRVPPGGYVTTLISVAADGSPANGPSQGPAISDDGRSVAFASEASNLVSGDTNQVPDLFVRDRASETARVSVSTGGTQADDASGGASVSDDGRVVVFHSDASNLVADDTNAARDVFVHDRDTGETARVSVNSDGAQANDLSEQPSLDGIGRLVVFESDADNLVPDDDNEAWDTFVHDRDSGATTRAGSDLGPHSNRPTISGDGRVVAFEGADLSGGAQRPLQGGCDRP